MRHDERTQETTGLAIKALDLARRRAQEIVEEEDAADASLTSRSDLALRCLAANGEPDAVGELTRRTVEPAVA